MINENPSAATVLTRSELLADPNEEMASLTIGGLLQERAAQYPDRIALTGVRAATGATESLTYRQLEDEAGRVATAIAGRARAGERVALWAPNVIEWPIIEYGAALAGVVLVALNPVLRAGELEYALRHSGSALLIHADRSRDYDLASVVADLVPTAFPELATLSLTSDWLPATPDPAVLAAAPTDPHQPVMLQYTSGTTGNPKGVVLSHYSLVNDARLTVDTLGIASGAGCVNPLPMFHTAACVIGTLGPLWLGGTEILIERFEPGTVLEALRGEAVSVLFYVPAILKALLDAQAASPAPAPRLDVVLGGAANVPSTMIEAAERAFGATVINLFGQTELSPVLSCTRPGDSRADQLTTVGRPLPGVDCRIVDPASGAIVPIGEPGEICARGFLTFMEYQGDPEATARTVDADGFVHMGDLGVMDSRGFLSVTGRIKEIIIRGGENIAPAAVEAVIADHPSVASVAVVGVPDEKWGEIVAAVVTVTGDASEDLAESLKEHARARLAPYTVPAKWFVADELPTTPTGKVRKFQAVESLHSGRYRQL